MEEEYRRVGVGHGELRAQEVDELQASLAQLWNGGGRRQEDRRGRAQVSFPCSPAVDEGGGDR